MNAMEVQEPQDCFSLFSEKLRNAKVAFREEISRLSPDNNVLVLSMTPEDLLKHLVVARPMWSVILKDGLGALRLLMLASPQQTLPAEDVEVFDTMSDEQRKLLDRYARFFVNAVKELLQVTE